MIIIEVDKSDVKTINEIKDTFPNCKYFEENSFSGNDILYFIVPITTILSASPVLIQWIRSRKITIKYDNMEITGNAHHVLEALKIIQKGKENNNDDND